MTRGPGMSISAGLMPVPDIEAVADLRGGPRVLRHRLRDPLDAHELLSAGLPGQALTHLLGRLVLMKMSGPLEKAMGMSLRALQRRRDEPARPLSPEQSGRAWKLDQKSTRLNSSH